MYLIVTENDEKGRIWYKVVERNPVTNRYWEDGIGYGDRKLAEERLEYLKNNRELGK